MRPQALGADLAAEKARQEPCSPYRVFIGRNANKDDKSGGVALPSLSANRVRRHNPSRMVSYIRTRLIMLASEKVSCMWGLLAGKLQRGHKFNPRDRRLTYAIYQGEQWDRSQSFLDLLRGLSAEIGCTVSQLVIAWTIQQPGITVALCGAKRPEQIEETAQAMSVRLDDTVMIQIDRWLLEVNPGAASS